MAATGTTERRWPVPAEPHGKGTDGPEGSVALDLGFRLFLSRADRLRTLIARDAPGIVLRLEMHLLRASLPVHGESVTAEGPARRLPPTGPLPQPTERTWI